MKLYVDDIRNAPDESWTLVKNITEAIRFISMFGDKIKEISLDHDISFDVRIEGTYRPFPSPDNFSAVAYFIGERYGNSTGPTITVHSANPIGINNIVKILEDYGIPCKIRMMGEAHRVK